MGVAILLFVQVLKDNNISPLLNDETAVKSQDISTLPIFTNGLITQGIELDEIGYHSFSPDGKYFVFTGIKDSDLIPAKTYLVKLSTGEVVKLPGVLLRGFEDSRLVVLFKAKDLVLYNIATGESDNIATDGNIFAGALSPDGTKYVFNTLEGVMLYDRNTKKTVAISTTQYDGATAWLEDSNRVLGFKDNGKKIFDAGNGRELGIWDINSKTFSPLMPNTIPVGTIRNVTWVIPDTVARINTGWDDSSHDYLLNIKTGEIVDLGDTSSSLMGGMKDEPRMDLFALVRGYGDLDSTITASVYRGLDKTTSAIIPSKYIRENLHIVDQDSVIYIRKHLSPTQTIDNTALIKLNFKTGAESVLKELEINVYNSLSLNIEQKIWVVSSKNKFFVGKLP